MVGSPEETIGGRRKSTAGSHGSVPITLVTGRHIADQLRRTALAVTFWAGVALPVLYLPLMASGIDTPSELVTFLWLFGLHVLALVGGRRHRRVAVS